MSTDIKAFIEHLIEDEHCNCRKSIQLSAYKDQATNDVHCNWIRLAKR